MTEGPIFRGNTLSRKTGSWRDPEMKQKPRYSIGAESSSPCKNACPLENEIPHWISLLKDGKELEAWEKLIEKNPLPASIGRICQAFCEAGCNRREFDEALSIRNLEKFLGDKALNRGWKIKLNVVVRPQKIAVVGGGPAGLSCAYQLAKKGYAVSIFEKFPELGGLLKFGIPSYRLPKDVLKAEIQNNILCLGMEMEVNNNFKMDSIPGYFDAVFVAAGLWRSKSPAVLGSNTNVISALDFLSSLNLGKKLKVGRRVLVIGAGNTGIDAARVSKRLGAQQVDIIELLKKKDVLADPGERELALREGVNIHYESKISRVKESDDKLEAVYYWENGIEWLARGVDDVIVAIGQEPEIIVSDEGKIFTGGDLKTQAGSAASAIGSGRKAAETIDYYLKNGQRNTEPVKPLKIVSFNNINTAYFKEQNRNKFPNLEAERCFSCGLCRECENCFNFCPEPAVKRTGNSERPYAVDYDYCKGCGICAKECPRGVIVMEEEKNESE